MKNKINIKKVLLLILIVVVVIIGAILIINKWVGEPEKPVDPDEQSPIIELPNTTYSEMEVKNIHMEYLKDNDETVVRFDILNTTSEKVENQKFTTVLIGPDDEVLAEMPFTPIQDLDVGQQHALEVIFDGDVTATKQIKLIQK